MKTGIQLYNFREALKQDFKGSLKEISRIGFDGVEFASEYGGIAPEELAAYLKELKLECAGTMFREKDLVSGENRVYEYAEQLNSPAVTISIMLDFTKEYDSVLNRIKAVGETAKKHHRIFSYHNHWNEFAVLNGKSVIENLLDSTDPEAVFWEPDVCWVTWAGGNAPALIRKYGTRIRQVHLKDLRKTDDMTVPLGTGDIPVAECAAAAREIHALWGIYEQDSSKDPFADAAASLKYLRSL